jgi:hypothetical protein
VPSQTFHTPFLVVLTCSPRLQDLSRAKRAALSTSVISLRRRGGLVFRRPAFGIRIPKSTGQSPPLSPTHQHTLLLMSTWIHALSPSGSYNACHISPALSLSSSSRSSRPFPFHSLTPSPLTLQTQPRRAPLILLHPAHPTHRPHPAPHHRAYHLLPPRPGRGRRRTRISGCAMWETGRGRRDEEGGVAVVPRILGGRGRVEGERCHGG